MVTPQHLMAIFPVFIALSACGSSGSTPNEWVRGDWTHGNSRTFNGLMRTYSAYVPTVEQLQGLIVVMHGSGQGVTQLISELSAESVANQNGLLVVVPAGLNGGWNDEEPPGGELADDVGFIDGLVASLKSDFPSLPDDHVFAHGFSNGGGLATRLACESHQIRGIGVIGNYYTPIAGSCPRPTGRTIPGWFGAGVDDEVVPVESVRQAMSNYVTDLTDCPNVSGLQTVASADVPSGVVCKQFSECDRVRLCEYPDRGHEVLEGSVSAAFRFLQAVAGSSAN